MRILFVGARSIYSNPTEGLLPSVVARIGNVRQIGPGYSPLPATTPAGLREWASRNSFDALFIDASITLMAIGSSPDADRKELRKSTVRSASLEDLSTLAEFIWLIRNLEIPTISSLMRLDLHTWNDTWSKKLFQITDVFLGVDPDMRPTQLALDAAGRDPAFRSPAQNDYFSFAESHRDRVIPFPHFVSRSVDSPTNRRPRRSSVPTWAVPGLPYLERQLAVASLNEVGARVKTSAAYKVTSASYRLGKGQSLAARFARDRYKRLIENSDASFVSGSALGLPVRKYFEIPALGCLMVGVPFNKMKSLGFNEGEHYIEAAPEQLPAVHRWLIENRQQAEDIARRGSGFVWSKHSDSARAAMLRHYLENSIGSRPTVRWRNGDWTME